MPAFASDRLLSAWHLNSGEVFLASLRDAELATNPCISKNGDLHDPPSQAIEVQSKIYGELKEEEPKLEPKDSFGRNRRARGVEASWQARRCPSKDAPPLDVNTVEVVKRDGQYHLVMDGVSYGPLGAGENRFWIPRFKESSIDQDGSSAKRRVVQPVLFSMRIEAFEVVPSACFVEARQRVVNDGTLYMEDNVIKTNDIKPYQTSSMSAEVTILPYPLICTPPPYVSINDYSKVLDRELALKLHHMPDEKRQEITAAYQTLLGSPVEAMTGAAASAASSMADTAKKAVVTLVGAAHTLFKLVTNRRVVTTAGAASSVVGVVPAVVTTGAAYLLWEYMRKGHTKPYSPKELPSVESALSSSLNRGPNIYRITIEKLTNMIYRVAETRANGSMMSESDNTLGMSIHDFQHQGWNEEAAFMQWLMFGNGTREGRDPVTGLYSEKSNTAHASLYADASAVDAAATMNTIGLQGLDGLSLSNCRAEFSYAIKIKESDGSDGPIVLLNSTRINGLDAGWLASGLNDKFRECRRAADYLRYRLASLPGVSRYMASRGTMVSDTNNGAILCNDLTDAQRLLLGRVVEDANGVSIKETDLKQRLDNAKSRKEDADKRNLAHAEYVEERRKKVNYAKKLLADANTVDRIRRAKKNLATQQHKLEEAEQLQELYAGEAAYRQSLQDDAQQLASGNPRRFVNIFDYEDVHFRIVKELLGGPLFGEDGNDSDKRVYEDDLDTRLEEDDKFDQETTRSFWKNVVTGEPEGVQTDIVDRHIQTSREAFADSMSYFAHEIPIQDERVIRFMRFMCPVSLKLNADSMRFAAFVVPRSAERLCFENPHMPRVTRILPQILSFQSTIIQPTDVSEKTFIVQDEASLAAKTIAQARVALRSMTAVFPRLLNDMRIYDTTGHLCQIYYLNKDQSKVSMIFNRPISRESITPDFLSLSFVPGASTLEAMLQADKAGGDFLGMMARIASGQRLAGVAKLVSDAGLSVEVSSFIAAASFSEIVAYHLVEHGVVVDDKSGFELQRIELVRNAVFNAMYSSQVIGQFLSDNYSGNKSKTKDISYDDVCFHCIPGLSHLHTALRRLGIFSSFNSSTSMELCHRVGKALYRLGSSQRSTLEGFPFVCLQSAVASVPKSVRFVEGYYASSIDIHVKLCALSYERMLLGSSFCATDPRANACLCIDVVYTRPSVLKQFHLRPLEFTRVASESKNAKTQSKWQPPSPSMSMKALEYRAAKLRLDIHEEYKNESAASELSVVNDELNLIAQMDLVKKMNALDVRDLASIDVLNPVANFMVPFGMTDVGTTRDIIHSKFEQQAVWIQEIEASAASVIVSCKSTPDVIARSAKLDTHGRPNHPLVLKMKTKAAELVLFANKKIGSDEFGVIPPEMTNMALSLPSICEYIKHHNSVTGVSGRLAEHYRTSMHNAERLFQLVVLVSSGVAGPGPAENLTIELDLEDVEVYHMPAFVACVCIANALAKSIVGSSCMVVTKDSSKGEVEACAKIRRMCQGMLRAGMKAVPFCEICAVTSLL